MHVKLKNTTTTAGLHTTSRAWRAVPRNWPHGPQGPRLGGPLGPGPVAPLGKKYENWSGVAPRCIPSRLRKSRLLREYIYIYIYIHLHTYTIVLYHITSHRTTSYHIQLQSSHLLLSTRRTVFICISTALALSGPSIAINHEFEGVQLFVAFVVEGGSSSGGEQSIVLLRVAVDDVASSWSTNYGHSGKMTQNI